MTRDRQVTRFAKSCSKRLLWQFMKNNDGLTPVKVLTGPSRGTRLIIDIRTEASYWLGSYDKKILAIVSRSLKAGQIAYDCGAFLGYYAAAMRKVVGNSGKVFLFEASSMNFARAVQLPQMNGWRNVEVYHLAIGKAHSRINFVSDQGPGSGPANKWHNNSAYSLETVECVGIDELVYERGFAPPDFLKLDLETAEQYALLNGARLWNEKRPTLLVELHGPDTFNAAEEFLRRFSYCATEIHLGRSVKTALDFYSTQEEGVQCTILAVPNR